MGRRMSRVKDKGIYSEFDPKMKKLFDPDIAANKIKFWKFQDDVKRVYPKAKPLMSMVAENNCHQCEIRSWTKKVLVVRNINENQIFNMCDVCFPQFEELCKNKIVRYHIINERLPY